MSVANGLSRHPFYPRWVSMNERCYNPEHKSFTHFGGCGVEVCEDWRADNAQGCQNFIRWLNEEIRRNRPQLLLQGKLEFEVGRRELEQHYSPANCELRPKGMHSQKRRHVELTLLQVVQLRQRKRADPKLSLSMLQAETGVSPATLSRALRGLLWACADRLEPPLATLSARHGRATEEPLYVADPAAAIPLQENPYDLAV